MILYKEISPNSILVSGGQSNVANLFYNMSTRKIGLVGMWDCVAFDEVEGIKFKDNDGIQIMKDYMASGYFADSFAKYFKLGNNLNKRDVIGVKKTVSGLVKLIYPDGQYEKEDIEEILQFSLEGRRRVKEQL